jgi:N12 class adenine-specific DNA methylase
MLVLDSQCLQIANAVRAGTVTPALARRQLEQYAKRKGTDQHHFAWDETAPAYGYCPKCGAPGKMRERRFGGDDTCEQGHVYPSADATQKPIKKYERYNPRPEERAPDPGQDQKELAQHYADLWNSMKDAGQDVDGAELEKVEAELADSPWCLRRGDNGHWGVHPSPAVHGPEQYAAQRSPPGGIQIGGRWFRGGLWIPSAAIAQLPTAEQQRITESAQQHVQRRQARGNVSHASLGARLEPHANQHPLDAASQGKVAASFRSLHSHHGELALHRIEELADSTEKAMAKAPKGRARQELGRKLAGYHSMLGLAKAKGVTGEVPPGVQAPPEAPKAPPMESAAQRTPKAAAGQGSLFASTPPPTGQQGSLFSGIPTSAGSQTGQSTPLAQQLRASIAMRVAEGVRSGDMTPEEGRRHLASAAVHPQPPGTPAPASPEQGPPTTPARDSPIAAPPSAASQTPAPAPAQPASPPESPMATPPAPEPSQPVAGGAPPHLQPYIDQLKDPATAAKAMQAIRDFPGTGLQTIAKGLGLAANPADKTAAYKAIQRHVAKLAPPAPTTVPSTPPALSQPSQEAPPVPPAEAVTTPSVPAAPPAEPAPAPAPPAPPPMSPAEIHAGLKEALAGGTVSTRDLAQKFPDKDTLAKALGTLLAHGEIEQNRAGDWRLRGKAANLGTKTPPEMPKVAGTPPPATQPTPTAPAQPKPDFEREKQRLEAAIKQPGLSTTWRSNLENQLADLMHGGKQGLDKAVSEGAFNVSGADLSKAFDQFKAKPPPTAEEVAAQKAHSDDWLKRASAEAEAEKQRKIEKLQTVQPSKHKPPTGQTSIIDRAHEEMGRSHAEALKRSAPSHTLEVPKILEAVKNGTMSPADARARLQKLDAYLTTPRHKAKTHGDVEKQRAEVAEAAKGLGATNGAAAPATASKSATLRAKLQAKHGQTLPAQLKDLLESVQAGEKLLSDPQADEETKQHAQNAVDVASKALEDAVGAEPEKPPEKPKRKASEVADHAARKAERDAAAKRESDVRKLMELRSRTGKPVAKVAAAEPMPAAESRTKESAKVDESVLSAVMRSFSDHGGGMHPDRDKALSPDDVSAGAGAILGRDLTPQEFQAAVQQLLNEGEKLPLSWVKTAQHFARDEALRIADQVRSGSMTPQEGRASLEAIPFDRRYKSAPGQGSLFDFPAEPVEQPTTVGPVEPVAPKALPGKPQTLEQANEMVRQHFASGKPYQDLIDSIYDLPKPLKQEFMQHHGMTGHDIEDVSKLHGNLVKNAGMAPPPVASSAPAAPATPAAAPLSQTGHVSQGGLFETLHPRGHATPDKAGHVNKGEFAPKGTAGALAVADKVKSGAMKPDEGRKALDAIEKGGKIKPEVPHGQLAGTSSAGDQGGLFPAEPVGKPAASPPPQPVPGKGEGTGAGPGAVPAGHDQRRDEPGGTAGGTGNQPRDSAGSGTGTTLAAASGGGGQAGGVGDAGSAGGRSGSGPASLADKLLAQPPTPENPTDVRAPNFKYVGRDFLVAGLKAKFNANIEAIKTLQAIKAEGRDTATPAEQAVMSKYVGWGQFPALFNDYYDTDWKKQREQLQSLLSDDEYDSAKRSILNAHYTHPDVVDAHWKMAQRLGFKGGRFLETSAGIGYYLGMMPDAVRGKTKASAVELDSTTGGMLKLLYPRDNVQIQGFQDHKAPPGFYDLVASNVPFGDYKVHDPDYNKHQANIHDYFFLKSADLVRPGGLVMHITSTGTLDKPNSKIREELAKTCDLVAAVRFPAKAHKENAGTDVVTDMLILRKRLPGEQPGETNWLKTTTVPDPAGGEDIPVNQYFADHPEQILGTLDRTGTMYRGESVNVTKTADYEQRLAAAIERLPAGIITSAAPTKPFQPQVMPAPGDVKDGGYKIEGGKVYARDGGSLVEQKVSGEAMARIQGQLRIRDALREVLNRQIAGEDASAARANLNQVYDAFVQKHGFLNEPVNKRLFRTDPDGPVLQALEDYNPKTKKATKADAFSKDTIRVIPKASKAGNVGEALGISLHESGGVDIDRMAELTGHDAQRIGKALVDAGMAYEDPSEGWKPADQYLSGNVRRKLALAKAAAAADAKYAPNVAALEKVQPEDIDYGEIDVKLGAPWVPPSDIKAFAAHLLGGRPEHFDINYLPKTGEWQADYSRNGFFAVGNSEVARKVWATPRKSFDDLLQAALNNSSLTVYDKDPDGKAVANREATQDAQAKAQEIKEAFKSWIWDDDERRDRLHRYYNDNFNNVRPIQYDGSHQQFPGMNPAVKLHPHIPNFVWQVVTTGKGLAAHEVGMGKTFAMLASAMELRRLGLARKPAIACLKANIEQITKDAQRLYPGANILSTADMFDAANRKKTISRIATGDYDIVILTHDHLDLLQMKPETVQQYINEEIDELEAAKTASMELNPKKDNRVVKALEKAKQRLQARLAEALDASKKDNAIYFEETGIDTLFVDEFHKYKSLMVYTKQDRLKGVPNSRSDRATAMLMRTRWLMEHNGGRGVVCATGTPVANTMAELYNLQRYLQPEELKERGLNSFDAWANTFGDVQTKMEFTVGGEYKAVSRFARFVNIPELMQMARQIMDVQRIENLKGNTAIVRPHRKDNVVISPKSPAMTKLMEELQARAKALQGKRPGESTDNMLVICTDGRKGALDMRLLDPSAEDDPGSKTNMAVRNVLDVHQKQPGVTQIIFSDLGVNPTPGGFSLYGDIIDKLVAGGIPRERIADFSKLEGAKKDAAMAAMRKGDILVALGSTEKLGTGVNVQNKLAALHHLDVPWLPASVEQRDGRGWRHGNENKNLDIYRYVAEGSLDQTFWQIIANKTRFIKQVISGADKSTRVAKEEDSEELSPEQLMAAASGDPRVLEKVNLDEDVKNLRAAMDRHQREQVKLKKTVTDSASRIPKLKERAVAIGKDVQDLEGNPDFSLQLGQQTFTDRKEATAALSAKVTEADKEIADQRYGDKHPVPLGKFRGMGLLRHNGRFILKGPGTEYETGDSLASVEYVARNAPKRLAEAIRDLDKAVEDLDRVKATIGKTFPKAEELETKKKRLDELNADLAKPKEKKEGDGEEPAAEEPKQIEGPKQFDRSLRIVDLVRYWKMQPAQARSMLQPRPSLSPLEIADAVRSGTLPIQKAREMLAAIGA